MHIDDLIAAAPLERATTTPLFRQLYARLKDAILHGRLAPGTRLPTTRALAQQLQVSRQTVLAAYEQLTAEGYLRGGVGQGTFVDAGLPAMRAAPGPAGAAPGAPRPLPARGLAMASSMARVRHHVGPLRAFRPSMPGLDLFPFAVWRAALAPPGAAAGLWRRRRLCAAARTAVRLPECLTRGSLHARADHRHHRIAAGPLPAGAAAAGAGRGRVAGVAWLPGCRRALRGGGCAHVPGAGRRRRHGRRLCGHPLPGRRNGLRYSFAPAAPGREHEPGPAPRAAALGRGEPCLDRRGRLRQRIPLHRATPGLAAEPRPRRLRDLRRHPVQGAVPGPAPRLCGGAAGTGRTADTGQGGGRPPQPGGVAGGAGRLHQAGPFCASHPAHPRGLCRAPRRDAGRARKPPGGMLSCGPADTGLDVCVRLAGPLGEAEAVARASAAGVELRPLSYYAHPAAGPDCAALPGMLLGFSAFTPTQIRAGIDRLEQALAP